MSNALLNPHVQLHKAIDEGKLAYRPPINSPFGRYDCSPVADVTSLGSARAVCPRRWAEEPCNPASPGPRGQHEGGLELRRPAVGQTTLPVAREDSRTIPHVHETRTQR